MTSLDDFEKQVAETDLPTPINAATWIDTEPPEPDQILQDTFDRGDKVAIIGSSKLRKSFFLLQLLLSIAADRDFLSFSIQKARRVLHIQFEIQANHFHRRVRRLARTLGITSADLGDRLQVVNARGLGISGPAGIKTITAVAKKYHPDVISFDPLYKVALGAENATEDVKATLNAFDELAEASGASILYVHHDPKGFSGDRDIRDRGAGSNVLGRDYDACITLTPHVTEADAVVVETLLRNYRPQEPFTILWTEDENSDGYCFDLRPEIVPTKKTFANGRKKNEPPIDSYLPIALDILKDRPLPMGEFLDRFRTKTGETHARTKSFRNWVLSGPQPILETTERRTRGFHEKLIGTPDQILRMRDGKVQNE